MTGSLQGSFFACSSSLFWTISPICFAAAGRRIGAVSVNILRLAAAALLLCCIAVLHAAFRGSLSTLILPWNGALWLALSGLSGLVIGDAFYLKALTMLGPGRTTQVLTLAPIISVIAAWFVLGERLSWPVLGGIALVLAGILYTSGYEARAKIASTSEKKSTEPGVFSFKGLALAATATIFHGSGAVMSRQAFLAAPDIDPVSAAATRVAASALAIMIGAVALGKAGESVRSISQKGAFVPLALGTLAGPVVGMLFYVSAFKFADAGIVSVLSSLSPIFIIPAIAIRYRARIRREAAIGTLLAVAGVFLIGAAR